MASEQSRALGNMFESMAQRSAANPEMDIVTLRSMFDELGNLAREPEGVTYQEVDADGVPSILCTPQDADPTRAIFFTHGGGFVGNTAASHRKMAAHLGKAARAKVLIPDYRLAPEHPFPAQQEDCVTAYRWLVANSDSGTKFFTAGDSAGGNLAVSMPGLLGESDPQPKAVVAFSPWTNMEHNGETLETNKDRDKMLTKELVFGLGAMIFGGDGTSTDPRANPLHADLSKLPPTYITVGSEEVLLSDSTRLADRAKDAGVEVKLNIAQDQQHVYEFMAGNAPEADEAIAEGATWIDKHA